MAVTAVVGANWGDEGKGKMVDYLASNSHFVVRFQGGSNAGHTVINDYGKFALHLLPSGVFYPGVVNVLGPGVALDVRAFAEEIDSLVQRDVPTPTIAVSDRAQVLMPYHRLFDEYEEERLGARQFGSTKSGIAPFYSDKYAKIGLQASELYDKESLRSRITHALELKNVLLEHLYGKPALDVEEVLEELSAQAEILRPYVTDTHKLFVDALRADKTILLEGQLGSLRDPDHGIYPFSTSSSTIAGYATIGAGLPPYVITEVLAVTKAYSSCVGAGPFVTELEGEEAEELRRRGGDAGEYGAKTGRPRRVGWFDAVATRYGASVQGATALALTNLDVLGYLDTIPVCVAYEIEGRVTTDFPTTSLIWKAKPVLRHMPGWKTDISAARHLSDLPKEARDYVAMIERETGVKVKWVSVGPRREQTFEA
ncbi:MAG: adenylosuccinate synthase [Bacillota bacterium]|jgi:adenylosuccinate synthase|nr:adenylosuccinate synthase [Candidatus Fermentithermobacillaceae bacterium]